MDDMHDLTPFYAIGALEHDEIAAYEEHLDGCEGCRDELKQLQGGVEVLALAVAEEPPAALRTAVMERIDTSERRLAPVIPIARRWRVIAAVAAVAAIVNGVLLVGAFGRLSDADRALEVMASTDAKTLTLSTTPVGPVRFVWSGELGRGVFSASAVPALRSSETYELWYMDQAGNPTPAGLFEPGGDGSVLVLVDEPVFPGAVLGLTIEPAGGSDTPTGEVLIAEDIT